MGIIGTVWLWFADSFHTTWYWVIGFVVWWCLAYVESIMNGGMPHGWREHILEPFDCALTLMEHDPLWLIGWAFYFVFWPAIIILAVLLIALAGVAWLCRSFLDTVAPRTSE